MLYIVQKKKKKKKKKNFLYLKKYNEWYTN
jgi:hypothetical protein